MNLDSFFIEFEYNNDTELAEVTPCCQQDSVYYYDIAIKNKYQFTIAPNPNDEAEHNWRVALKNADNDVDQDIVTIIGDHIEKHYLQH